MSIAYSSTRSARLQYVRFFPRVSACDYIIGRDVRWVQGHEPQEVDESEYKQAIDMINPSTDVSLNFIPFTTYESIEQFKYEPYHLIEFISNEHTLDEYKQFIISHSEIVSNNDKEESMKELIKMQKYEHALILLQFEVNTLTTFINAYFSSLNLALVTNISDVFAMLEHDAIFHRLRPYQIKDIITKLVDSQITTILSNNCENNPHRYKHKPCTDESVITHFIDTFSKSNFRCILFIDTLECYIESLLTIQHGARRAFWLYYTLQQNKDKFCGKSSTKLLFSCKEEFLRVCIWSLNIYNVELFQELFPETTISIDNIPNIFLIHNNTLPTNEDDFERLLNMYKFLVENCKELVDNCDNQNYLFRKILSHQHKSKGNHIPFSKIVPFLQYLYDRFSMRDTITTSTLKKIVLSISDNNHNLSYIIYTDGYHYLHEKHPELLIEMDNDLFAFLENAIRMNYLETADFIFTEFIRTDEDKTHFYTVLENVFSSIILDDSCFYSNSTETQVLRERYVPIMKWIYNADPTTFILLQRDDTNTIVGGKIQKALVLSRTVCACDISGGITNCSVCQENPCDIYTECKHTFCRSCISHWVENCSNTCPLCRKQIVLSSLFKIIETQD
jgi:hypothetical protein